MQTFLNGTGLRRSLSAVLLTAAFLLITLAWGVPAQAQTPECVPVYPPTEICPGQIVDEILPPSPVDTYPYVQDPTSRAHTSDALMYTWGAKGSKTVLGVYARLAMQAREELGIPDTAWALTTGQEYLVRERIDFLLLERAERLTMPIITDVNGKIDNITRNEILAAVCEQECMAAGPTQKVTTT